MSDLSDRLQAALVDRYTIERELGRGGMAIVYLARDLRHERAVALKVLRPELAASIGAERFLREIRTAAQLTHPNILPLHDSGEADGTLYYTMPYVDGESLRDRLNREKQLPIEDALQITKEVADALGYAHEQGIIHRDIKPENILFQSGHALVADFGIARAVSAAGAETLTETGLAVGTPAYMSPEQGAGDSDLDGRSDLYSLGCVLYEMLTGETPYLGGTPQAIIAKKLSEPTPRVSVVRNTVPPAVGAALDRALSRNAVDRFATAAEFATALGAAEPAPPQCRPARRLAVLATLAVAIVALGAYGAWWFFTSGKPGTVFATGAIDRGDRVLLADFVNRTDDSTLGDVVHEGLRTSLAEARIVYVVDRATVRELLERKGLPRETRLDDEELAGEIAERANAKAFISGELSQVGSAYQLTARVIATVDGTELRAVQETARDEDDFIDAVHRLGGKLRRDIGESVRSAMSRHALAFATTASLDALREYSAGMRLEPDDIQQSKPVARLREAVRLDSTFASAYAQLARHLGNAQFPSRLTEARVMSERGMRFRDRLPLGDRLLVEAVHYLVHGDLAAAARAYERMLELEPQSCEAGGGFSELRLRQRRFAEAKQLALDAFETGCRGMPVIYNAVEAMVAQGEFPSADSLLAQLDPSPTLSSVKGYVLLARRKWDEALSFFADDSVSRARGMWGGSRLLLRLMHGHTAPVFGRATRPIWPLLELRYRGDSASASLDLDAWFVRQDWDSLLGYDRSWWEVIFLLAELGRVSEARILLDEWKALEPADPRLSEFVAYCEGAVAFAEGMVDSAAAAFLRAHDAPFAGSSHVQNRGLVEAARALERLGRADTAIVLYQAALAQPSIGFDAVLYEVSWYPFVLRRLAELHASLGHRDKAIDYYSQFIDLWKDADPVLQPQVEEARAAVVRLAEERG